jgi:aryl-alcohol dehydrogenase-like predicted oxidoreductase
MPMTQHRTLGPDRLAVSALGLGCMGMSGVLLAVRDDEESIATIHRASISVSIS